MSDAPTAPDAPAPAAPDAPVPDAAPPTPAPDPAPAPEAAPAVPWDGPTFEYQVLAMSGAGGHGSLTDQLNELGGQGWEVVSAQLAGAMITVLLMRESPAG